jgi:hypothetical protein
MKSDITLRQYLVDSDKEIQLLVLLLMFPERELECDSAVGCLWLRPIVKYVATVFYRLIQGWAL